MRARCNLWFLTLAALSVAATPGVAGAQPLDVVIQWNRILQTTVASTPTPTVFFTRPYAMTGVAVFDALNSIDHVYQPYLIELSAPANASREAAIAQAAHDVLVALYPGQRATLDAALTATLSGLTGGGVNDGTQTGARVARAVLDARANDGWDGQPSPYLLPSLPGFYQVTPPQNATVTYTHYPDVTPFFLPDRLRFRPAPPPALTSEHYAADLNEVKAIGRNTSTTRTTEQSSIAQRWAAINTPTQFQFVWNDLVADVARRMNVNAVDAARAYALLSMTMHDGLLNSFNGKFLYGLWRPVTAIREADRDDNPATVGDPTWLSFIPTPPYPSYPGNMTCMGAVASRTLQRFVGRNDVSFTVTWRGLPGNPDIVRSYNGFRELADEQAKSRIYGGIHFWFDQEASFGECIPMADYAFDNFIRPRAQTR
jgi:hypothetical protein